jgi:hypothetical protein
MREILQGYDGHNGGGEGELLDPNCFEVRQRINT